MNHHISIVTVAADQLQALIEEAVTKAVVKALSLAPRTTTPPSSPADDRRAWPEMMDRVLAAEYLGVSAKSLAVDVCRRRWRVPFLRIGKKIVYERSALDLWLEERRRSG